MLILKLWCLKTPGRDCMVPYSTVGRQLQNFVYCCKLSFSQPRWFLFSHWGGWFVCWLYSWLTWNNCNESWVRSMYVREVPSFSWKVVKRNFLHLIHRWTAIPPELPDSQVTSLFVRFSLIIPLLNLLLSPGTEIHVNGLWVEVVVHVGNFSAERYEWSH